MQSGKHAQSSQVFTRLPVNNRNSSPDQTNPFRKIKAINSVYLTLPFILKEPLTPQPSLVREKSALGYTAPRRDLGGGGGGEMWGESGCFVLQLKEASFKLAARPSSHLKTQGIK